MTNQLSDVTYRLINATKQLVAFCDQAKTQGWVAIDTEFVRERTYYAQLGLVQLALADDVILVDPLTIDDLEPLWQLIADPEVIKVLHSGGEDIELLAHCAQRTPQNFFDSQIAATMLGLGDAMGYAAMVAQFFGVELDKSQSRTNWLARPLTPEQLVYAAADVYYLARIYPQLLEQLVATKRLDMFADECALQIAKRTTRTPDDLAWRDIGNAWQCEGQQRAVLQELAAWRLATAKAQDKPLGFIVKDAALVDLARRGPQTMSHLGGVQELHPQAIRRYGEAILQAVARGQARAHEDIPAPMPRLDFEPGYKVVFKKLKAEVKQQADALALPAPFVGSRKQINELFHWYWFSDEALKRRLPTPDLISGWRKALFKTKVEALLLPRP
ncbi:ribonuclease D [Aliidiomarina maris]|uniref:Ribonuclease D n=1 Tax=Aliidiomarina maris TaxID=531312 RepID=A0A327XC06_9GAMM|nr:ribonuclease D [Aliidiomarina maris]RAK01816.1 ribonuclease D [Aliidiomarina maris]RUO28627.1 ribonuclease D [Aliidiomarina maris]